MRLHWLVTPILAGVIPSSGIDVGGATTKVCVVAPGYPFDIVLNSESQRATESLMSVSEPYSKFGSQSFHTTESFIYSNFFDYVRTPGDLSYRHDMSTLNDRPAITLQDGSLVWPETLTTTWFGHLNTLVRTHIEEVGRRELNSAIGVPSNWTYRHRQILSQLAHASGLNINGIYNSPIGAAAINMLTYSGNATRKGYLSFGHDVIDFCIVELNPEAAQMKVAQCDAIYGRAGRSVDRLVAQLIAEMCPDMNIGPMRLEKIGRDVKERLSLGPTAKFSLGDQNCSGEINSAKLYELMDQGAFTADITSLLQRVYAGESAGLLVEVVGNGWRLPYFKDLLTKEFLVSGHQMHTRLNSDESIASGLSLLSASKTNGYRIKKFEKIIEAPRGFSVQMLMGEHSIDTMPLEIPYQDSYIERNYDVSSDAFSSELRKGSRIRLLVRGPEGLYDVHELADYGVYQTLCKKSIDTVQKARHEFDGSGSVHDEWTEPSLVSELDCDMLSLKVILGFNARGEVHVRRAAIEYKEALLRTTKIPVISTTSTTTSTITEASLNSLPSSASESEANVTASDFSTESSDEQTTDLVSDTISSATSITGTHYVIVIKKRTVTLWSRVLDYPTLVKEHTSIDMSSYVKPFPLTESELDQVKSWNKSLAERDHHYITLMAKRNEFESEIYRLKQTVADLIDNFGSQGELESETLHTVMDEIVTWEEWLYNDARNCADVKCFNDLTHFVDTTNQGILVELLANIASTKMENRVEDLIVSMEKRSTRLQEQQIPELRKEIVNFKTWFDTEKQKTQITEDMLEQQWKKVQKKFKYLKNKPVFEL